MTLPSLPPPLPELSELAAAAARWRPQENFTRKLHDWFQRLIVQMRGPRSRPFYSVREVARALQLHHSTVADVYARLEAEGLLVRVRGSGTLIPATRPVSEHQVVGIPVWVPGFRWLAEWRVFHMRLQDELSRHNAVADFIFYRQGEEVLPKFLQRIKAHRPDCVCWFEPHPMIDRQPLLRLRDSGLPLVTVCDRPVRLPGHGYWTERQAAYETGLREWQAAGLERVLVVGHGRQPQDGHLHQALTTVGMKFTMIRQPDQPTPAFFQNLHRPRCGVVWDDALTHLGVSVQAPEAMKNLYRQTRVMLARSRMLWTDTPPDIQVDALHFDCVAVADRVARELVSGDILRTATRPIFEWQWRSRITARDVITDGEGL